MILTDEQNLILTELFLFAKNHVFYKSYKKRAPYRVVGGYAGTGKTTLICYLRQELEKISKEMSVAFCSFTGKASSVLNSKLEENNSIYNEDYIGTIHGLIYRPEFTIDPIKGKKIISKWVKKSTIDFNLIIIDEASMVNEMMFQDLLSYDIPIIAFGDHGQLPPVDSNGFNLMTAPHYRLEQIMRQSEDNPILQLATLARTEGRIPFGTYGKYVFKMNWNDPKCKEKFDNIKNDEGTIILCGINKTRLDINRRIRNKMQLILPDPYPGERLICLKNNRITKVMNGQLGTLEWLIPEDKKFYRITIQLDGVREPYSNLVHNSCFGKEKYDDVYNVVNTKQRKRLKEKKGYDNFDFFDFGYAITVHKSQGSEWDRVVLFEEQFMNNDDFKKWLYTGITRSKERLFIIGI